MKNPQILILDEATSALDNATEMTIQESLDELSKGRTVIVVAHRLSTLRNADRIAVITSDGIAEEGTKEELLAQDGIYRRLYQYQCDILPPPTLMLRGGGFPVKNANALR
ncbi:MAG: hypothetical protein J6D38_09090 [Solobacterium sp.]|nr:hypothetical protein [Solobacterium sp.]